MLALLIYLIVLLLDRQKQDDSGEGPGWSNSTLPFVLLLIGMAVILSLGPEFVYLKDNFGQRLNTIFKFYYQSWLLFGVAAVFSLHFLLRYFRTAGVIVTGIYGLALFFSLLFPWYAVQSRAVEYRGSVTAADRQPPTLDGLAFMRRFNPSDYEAILWLRENVDGAAVIAEAVGGQYSGYGRVSASTGIPTVLGWAGHEYQWRGATPEPAQREPVIRDIYSPGSWETTAELLNTYDIEYIYVGPLEKSTYDPRIDEKFERNLEVVYRNDSVSIYRWNPQ
jgi:uncharacterized membrane protein